ncbi:hypothetical protein [Methanobrevibacter arboriphilus]|uniref:Uncharacterized protein n=1 Tax=Methanobrevibacter arboriphilus TaxID=39441 RepID=A0ACA8R3Z5_METAZ|nr:hypothetical protein [Methanobrevibacter arboriphilus]BBL62382.1 hypothetical protein MarbSA_14220 [Methanobrevibacter arboriphilus]
MFTKKFKDPYKPFVVIGKKKCKECQEETVYTLDGLCWICYDKKKKGD